MMRIKTVWIASSTVLATAMLSAGNVAPAAADTLAALDTQVVIDGSTAAGLCFTSYPDVTAGLDELSPCQWDMEVINALAAHTTARRVSALRSA
jgi:hypothetical protein